MIIVSGWEYILYPIDSSEDICVGHSKLGWVLLTNNNMKLYDQYTVSHCSHLTGLFEQG